jgi:Amidase
MLHDLSAPEQAAAVREREVSPIELVEHALARVAALDPGLGASITVTPEPAPAAAAAEHRLPAGGELPPLLGVPTAIKDLDDTTGVRTTFGRLRAAEALRGLHRALRHHRSARRQRAAALDRRRPADRHHAGRPARRRGHPDRAAGATGERPAVGAATSTHVVT